MFQIYAWGSNDKYERVKVIGTVNTENQARIMLKWLQKQSEGKQFSIAYGCGFPYDHDLKFEEFRCREFDPAPDGVIRLKKKWVSKAKEYEEAVIESLQD